MKIIFRFEEIHSHIIKIRKMMDIIEIYDPVEDRIFHMVNESE